MRKYITLFFCIIFNSCASFIPNNNTQSAEENFNLAETHYEAKEIAKALEHINYAISVKNDWAEAHQLKAFILLYLLEWQNALASARTALVLDPKLIKPHFFEAANFLLYGQYLTAIKTIRKVKKLHPNYSFNDDEQLGLITSYWRELISNANEELPQSGYIISNEALEIFPTQSFLLTMRGNFAWQQGYDKIANDSLEQALQQNPYSLRTVKVYRRFLLQNKKYKKAYKIWERIVPLDLVFDSRNKVANRYKRLKEAIKNVSESKNNTLLELARSLAFVGWEKEAKIIYEQVKGYKKEKEELENHLLFLEGLRKYVGTYYQTLKQDIVSMLTDMKKIAAKCNIKLKTIPSKEFNTYFGIIREVNHLDPKPQTLGNYLAKYNKFFDMGNNYGQIEIRMMNRISDKSYTRMIWGKKKTYRTITCDETYIDSFSGFFSGSPTIAGRAFLSNKGFYVAIDTLRPHIVTLNELHKRVLNPKPFPEKQKLQDKEFLPYVKSIADAFLYLSLHKEIENLPKNDTKWDALFQIIFTKRIDAVHNHELGHINDLPCFMPVTSHLGRNIRMLWKEGFSPKKIQTRFEHVAELFGMRHTKYLYFYFFQEMERLNTNFDGIFKLVYWAWYGHFPDSDPYYRSASKIYRALLKMTGKENDWKTLQKLTSISEEKLREQLHELCHKEEMVIDCDCQKP